MFERQIVGTRLGRAAKRIRSTAELWGCGADAVGTLANDQLAEILATSLPQRHFVDVGAHIGGVIAEVQARRPGVKITAIEPIPEKAAHLRKRFPKVDVVETALAEREGTAEFTVYATESGYSSLADVRDDGLKMTVALNRLDALVSDPDVIKIDVEGAELGVLRGCENLKSRPVYMFESGPGEVLGYTKTELWSWLNAHGYAVLLPNRVAHTAPPMSVELFLDSHDYPRRTTNYFGVPVEKIAATREAARKILYG